MKQPALILTCIALCARVATAAPVVAGLAAAEPAATEPAAAEPAELTHRELHLVGIGVAIGLYVSSEVGKDSLAPAACRWCKPPGFDDSVRRSLVWSDPKRAATISNVTGYAMAPLGAAGLLLASSWSADDHWRVFGDDLIAVTESVIYSQLIVQAVKFSVGRQRPYAHYGTLSPAQVTSDDDLSFLSGHSALTFAIATAAGSVAQRRHSGLAPVIWATGLGLAATTAYLRIAGDKHYLSDVLAGSALGAASGVLIPRLLGSLPRDLTVVPSPGGLALLGSF